MIVMRDVVDRILDEGIRSVSEDEYFDFVERAEQSLEDSNLVERDWREFLVVGDTHGELDAARRPAERAVARDIPIIYLGDYVDRGTKQLENLAFVLSLKIERPEKVVLLRGNHETERMNRGYGFYEVVKRSYSERLYKEIISLYPRLPVAAVIGKEYYAAHGGISSVIEDYMEINDLKTSDEGYREIFWNDPSEDIEDFQTNIRRGGYHLYGRKAVENFLTENDLSMIIRAHEVYQTGYMYYFDGKLLSIFSVSNYRRGNKGKFVHVKGEHIDLIDN